MNHIQSNKIKAAVLLSVFSFNTIIGFACSLGLDMGYNSKHHDEKESTEAVVHIHSDGKKHIHYEKKNTQEHNKPHQHDQDKTHHDSKEGKDNCCNDQVFKFEQTDKSIPHSLNIVHPLFLIAFLDVFYNVSLPSSGLIKDIKQFVRNYHPPIADIRIAIQSFQV
jgi:hypothetical protein